MGRQFSPEQKAIISYAVGDLVPEGEVPSITNRAQTAKETLTFQERLTRGGLAMLTFGAVGLGLKEIFTSPKLHPQSAYAQGMQEVETEVFPWQNERVYESPYSLTVLAPPLVLPGDQIGFLFHEQPSSPSDKPGSILFRLRQGERDYVETKNLFSLENRLFAGGEAKVRNRQIVAAFSVGDLDPAKKIKGQDFYHFAVTLWTGSPPLAQEAGGEILWHPEIRLTPDSNKSLYLYPKVFVDKDDALHLVFLEVILTSEDVSFQTMEELEGLFKGPAVEKLRIKHLLFSQGIEDGYRESVAVETDGLIWDFMLRESDDGLYLLYQEEDSLKQKQFFAEEKWGEEAVLDVSDFANFDVDGEHLVTTHGFDPTLSVYKLGQTGVVAEYDQIQRWEHGGTTRIVEVDDKPHVITAEHQRGTSSYAAQVSAYSLVGEIWSSRQRVGFGYGSLEVAQGKWLTPEGEAPEEPLAAAYSRYGKDSKQEIFFAYPLEIR